MTTICASLSPFLDGELEAPETDAFREHLPDCAECQSGLGDLMVLDAMAAQLKKESKP